MKFGARRLRWTVALGAVLLVAAAIVGFSVAHSQTADPTPVSVQISAQQTGQALPAGFVGLSLEYDAVHEYLGRNANAVNPLFLQLVSALAPGQSPVLRIGGDSSDHTWSPIPGELEPAGVNYELTPNWLATLHRAAADLHARLILGVNLAADNPGLAGAEARTIIHGVGGQYIDALEIGNEPDAYTAFAWYRTRGGQTDFSRGASWTEPAYQRQFQRWAQALPDVPLAGPADAYPQWMAQLLSLIQTAPHLDLVTFHRYPLRGCGADATGSMAPTISNLLAADSSVGLAQGVAPYVEVAHSAGLPFRVDELNSASCGGADGLSNTFASSLWILDTLFNMAAVGVDGVNIHTFPGAAYAPFSFTDADGVWRSTVNPLYYGMLMFTQAFPAGAHLLHSSTSTTASVTSFSTEDAGGTIRTVVINEDSSPAAVSLRAPGSGGSANVESLTAPSLDATTGVSLGGESFAPDSTTATLPAAQTSTIQRQLLGNYTVTVPADSAVLITF